MLHVNPGLIVQAYNTSYLWDMRQENHKFKPFIGDIVKPNLKMEGKNQIKRRLLV